MFNFSNNQKLRAQTEEAAPAKEAAAESNNAYAQQRLAEVEKQRLAFVRKNPDFNMSAEMQNPAFMQYIIGNGLTVEEAYILVHREELLAASRPDTEEKQAPAKERMLENGAGKNRPAIARKNPKDLSDKEIDAIIERVRNGEKITF